MSMCPFEVGQQVVCIDGEWDPTPPKGTHMPVAGGVYTVREMAPRRFGDIGLRLHEVRHYWFLWTHFRGVKTTDISDLQKLLAPTPKIKTSETV